MFGTVTLLDITLWVVDDSLRRGVPVLLVGECAVCVGKCWGHTVCLGDVCDSAS